MGCLIALIALISPRFALVLVWLFSDRVEIAFDDGFIAPFIGLVFLPWTTLMYTFAYAPIRGVSGIGWVFIVLALMVDLASYGGGARSRRGD